MIRSSGLAILIVEQHARQILPLTDRTVILERGRIVYQRTRSELKADPAKFEKWLGLADRR
ncbi:MAG: hypothetical protein HY879_22705 [Deltaproteobacteria bacterium]|nr:hypothetical protein [Deltaproteobacteria bacterium]